jgi:hypothetical protein
MGCLTSRSSRRSPRIGVESWVCCDAAARAAHRPGVSWAKKCTQTASDQRFLCWRFCQRQGLRSLKVRTWERRAARLQVGISSPARPANDRRRRGPAPSRPHHASVLPGGTRTFHRPPPFGATIPASVPVEPRAERLAVMDQAATSSRIVLVRAHRGSTCQRGGQLTSRLSRRSPRMAASSEHLLRCRGSRGSPARR